MTKSFVLAEITEYGIRETFDDLDDVQRARLKSRFELQLHALVPVLKQACFCRLDIRSRRDPSGRPMFRILLEARLPSNCAVPSNRDPFEAERESFLNGLRAIPGELRKLQMKMRLCPDGIPPDVRPVYDLLVCRTRQLWKISVDSGQKNFEGVFPMQLTRVNETPREILGRVGGTDERRIRLTGVRIDDGEGPALTLGELWIEDEGGRYRSGQRVAVKAFLHYCCGRCIAATAVGAPSSTSTPTPTKRRRSATVRTSAKSARASP